ncbi:MAG: tetratricopeptide repeat protein [Candidatus Acidiferrum sp.]|jgi:tetratricopeptide (TPR) repeat protein
MRVCRALLAALLLSLAVQAPGGRAQEASLEAGRRAYESTDYAAAIAILNQAAAKEPNNGEIQLLLTKAHLGVEQFNAAEKSGERAVAIDPKNSEYHNWLGQAYGGKADHASMFTAYSLAGKTRKEFETAVRLDERNFDAAQHLVEYDCTAPSIVGGGEEKARPLIQKLLLLDASQGHYAAGNCRRLKKNFPGADAEFMKALESHPNSLDIIEEIAGYFANRDVAERVLSAADAAEAAAPADPRGQFFRAMGWILQGEKLPDAEKILLNYIHAVPRHPSYPGPWAAHYWLGQLYEKQKNLAAARGEYGAALKLNAKYKRAQDALKQLGKS